MKASGKIVLVECGLEGRFFWDKVIMWQDWLEGRLSWWNVVSREGSFGIRL